MNQHEEDIKILNEIIEEGWLISDLNKCKAIDTCQRAIQALNTYEKLKKIKEKLDLCKDSHYRIMASCEYCIKIIDECFEE